MLILEKRKKIREKLPYHRVLKNKIEDDCEEF
jgi:hypothetical protein